MEIEKFLEDLKSGKAITGGSHEHELMHYLAEDAMLKTAQLNNSYHDAKIRRQLFSEIIGKPVDDTFAIFPPFYSECGKNIYVGKNVFINCCCHFQDHGGVMIGDGCQIGHNVVFATLNHGLAPEDIDWFISGKNGQEATDAVYTDLEHSLFPHALHSSFKEQCGEYQTASSYALWMAAKALKEEASSRYALIYNQYQGINHSIILIKRCTS